MMNDTLKTIVFTHNDLDGIACGIISKLYFPMSFVNYCNYDNIDDSLLTFLRHNKENLQSFRIIIADIYYKQENMEITLLLDKCGDLIIADHHATSAWIDNIPFSNDSTSKNIVPDSDKCGVTLLIEILEDKFKDIVFSGTTKEDIKQFVNHVNYWDVWTWIKFLPKLSNDENKTEDDVKREYESLKDSILTNKSFQLNSAAYYYGIENFVNKMLMYFNHYISYEDVISEKAMENAKKQVDLLNEYDTWHYIYDSAEYGKIPYTIIKIKSSNISLASILCKSAMQNGDKFLAIYIDEDKDAISLRCPAEDIDLSIIAKECEGGGHKDAAGCKKSVLIGNSKVN